MGARSAQGQFSLPAEYFLSRKIFDRETQLVRHSWIALGAVQEFAVGATPVELEGHRLVVLRDQEEVLRVVHNSCRHRGTILCEQPTTDQTRLVCPYHGWSFGLDGSLKSAPHMASTEGFSVDDYSLLQVESEVWQGILFVRFATDSSQPTLEQFLEPLTPHVTPWKIGGLSVAHQTHYEVDANWKLLFQNYSECYHCPILHPQLNRLTPFRDSSNVFADGPILGGPMELADTDGSMTTSGQRCAPLLEGLDAGHHGRVYYFTVFPNLFLSLHPDYVLVHCLRRLDVDRTAVDCRWLISPETAPEDFQPAVEFWDTTNRQDWHICERMQQGVSSPVYEPGPYSDLESLLAAFDRDYLERLGQ